MEVLKAEILGNIEWLKQADVAVTFKNPMTEKVFVDVFQWNIADMALRGGIDMGMVRRNGPINSIDGPIKDAFDRNGVDFGQQAQDAMAALNRSLAQEATIARAWAQAEQNQTQQGQLDAMSVGDYGSWVDNLQSVTILGNSIGGNGSPYATTIAPSSGFIYPITNVPYYQTVVSSPYRAPYELLRQLQEEVARLKAGKPEPKEENIPSIAKEERPLRKISV
jgi:hypothetical protein